MAHVNPMDYSHMAMPTAKPLQVLGDNKLTEELMDLQSRRPERSEGNAPKRVKLEVALKRVKHEAD